MTFALSTVAYQDQRLACLEVEGRYFPLARMAADAGELALPIDLIGIFQAWSVHFPTLERVAAHCRRTPDAALAPEQLTVVAPLQYPGKVLCAGANYYDHLQEMGVADLRKEAQRQFFFFKPPRSAVVGPGATVVYPRGSEMFDWEVELALVIGKPCKRLTMETALDAVAAYTVAIDFSARDFNMAPNTFYKLDWVAGKAQDTSCPLGPRLIPAAFLPNAQDLSLKLSVNGVLKQDARTSGMVFDIREQLVRLSNIMTLDAGDVLLTGTPAGVGFPKRTFLQPGDCVEAEIESIGKLAVTITEPQ